ncbi:hypothetical protein LCGC14_0731490 [marine sediment metagenome]|uniref:Zinc-ribbon domain-containing protein n=1 Tax=marine sediment metagenome TaxID=412755 RepID=A0A0F9QDJ0_9ZZZZ
MYRDKFVLSVIHDGHSVKETGNWGSKEVAIPFDSEYKLRLKNKNDRSCTVRVFIDDKRVSQLGDFILHAGGTIDLERFVDRSLNDGKRFKFVTLDHSDVDDPTSSENGIIRVEFRLAKQKNGINIQWEPLKPFKLPTSKWPTGPDKVWWSKDTTGTTIWPLNDGSIGGSPGNSTVYYSQTIGNNDTIRCSGKATTKSALHVASDSFAEKGATVEGGSSNQSFTYSGLDVETYATVLELRMVGIKKESVRSSTHKYCSNCGCKLKRRAKYCSECGFRA